MGSRDAWAAVMLASFCGACHGDFYEISTDDAGGAEAGAGADLGTAGDGSSGAEAGACTPAIAFVAIQADLDSLGCSALGCHGSGPPPPMHLTKGAEGVALMANYMEVKPRAASDAMSPLLQKSLAEGSTATHMGPKPIPTTSDPIYRRWLAWIRCGAPFAAPDGGAQ